MAKSVVGLHASRRWVLSGTPIVSSYFLYIASSTQSTKKNRLILRGYVEVVGKSRFIILSSGSRFHPHLPQNLPTIGQRGFLQAATSSTFEKRRTIRCRASKSKLHFVSILQLTNFFVRVGPYEPDLHPANKGGVCSFKLHRHLPYRVVDAR